MTAIATAFVRINPEMKGFGRDLQSGLNGPVTKTGKQSGMLLGRALMAGVAAIGVGSIFKDVIGGASSLNEIVSKSNTIFGDNGAEIEAWASTAAKSFGQSKRGALDSAATFGNMFTQLGVGTDQAADMSKQMVELGSDFASFHEAAPVDVLNAMQSAFRGEYDAVQRFVPTITAAAVEMQALEMGLAASTGELDAQDKALATQQLLMKGAGAAAGDFARTSGSLANQQLALGAQFTDLKDKIGTKLLPAVTGFVTFLNTNMIPTVKTVAAFLRDNWKPVLAALVPIVGGLLVGAFSTLATTVAAFMSPVIAVVGAVALLAAGLVYAYEHSETFRNIVNGAFEAVRSFAATVWPQIQGIISTVIDTIRGIIETAVGIIQGLWSAFGDNIMRIAKVAWDTIKGTVEGVLKVIKGIWDTFAGIFTGDWGRVWDGIKGILAGVWDVMKSLVSGAVGYLKEIVGIGIEALWTVWKNLWGKVRDWIGEVWGNIKTTVSRGVDAVIDFVKDIPRRIGEFASGMWDSISDSFRDMINNVIGWWNGLSFTIPPIDVPGPFNFEGATVNTPTIPYLDIGGEVLKTGIAVVHRGERFSGTRDQYPIGNGKSGPMSMALTISGPVRLVLANGQEFDAYVDGRADGRLEDRTHQYRVAGVQGVN